MEYQLNLVYKSCWELISDPFMECVRECFNHGEMSSSQRKAIITLIEKQHKIELSLKIGGQSLLLTWMQKSSQK